MASLHGLLVLDKPLGATSRDAVNRIQGLLPRGTKIGHTGTLDPLATGVLVLCLGQATRLAEFVQRLDKVYRARVRLGGRSATDDAEGPIAWHPSFGPVDEAIVRETLQDFVGVLEQTPPAYSAAKVSGRRAYALARSGKSVILAQRQVEIYDLEVLRYAYPQLHLEIRCGRGTYIRALARDLGERLGCGAFLESLRRLRVGSFDVAEAITLESSREQVLARVLPLSRAVDGLPRVTVDDSAARRFRQGQMLAMPAEQDSSSDYWAVWSRDGSLLGVSWLERDKRLLQPKVVLAPH